jgi:hypothetical protein
MSSDDGTKRDQERSKFRKRTELSLGIPLIAICLLVSPLLNGFTRDDGTPQFSTVIVYIFGIWGALILAAFIMSRVLSSDVAND